MYKKLDVSDVYQNYLWVRVTVEKRAKIARGNSVYETICSSHIFLFKFVNLFSRFFNFRSSLLLSFDISSGA